MKVALVMVAEVGVAVQIEVVLKALGIMEMVTLFILRYVLLSIAYCF